MVITDVFLLHYGSTILIPDLVNIKVNRTTLSLNVDSLQAVLGQPKFYKPNFVFSNFRVTSIKKTGTSQSKNETVKFSVFPVRLEIT